MKWTRTEKAAVDARCAEAPPAGQVREPARSLPVRRACDVLVVGGGVSGVAAAVAAARNGARVMLLERSFALGGLATLGMVTTWLPLCDGHGRQVTAGLAEELLKLSVRDVKHGRPSAHFEGIPPAWKTGGSATARTQVRYRVNFNPCAYWLALEAWALAAGVDVLYDTRVCQVLKAEGRLTHVLVENKCGRSALAARLFIDASGDADLCFLAGEETESLDSNVLAGWFYYLTQDELVRAPLSHRYHAQGAREGAAGPFFRGDDAREVNAQLLGSRELIRRKLDELRAREPQKEIEPVMTPTLPCLRMTRRLCVPRAMRAAQVCHTWLEDTVGLISDWRHAGPVYAMPLGALVAERTVNLLAVGRCLAADVTIWDVTRSLPGCVVSGEAAGTAAAVAMQESGGDLHRIAVPELQRQLRSQGVLLDPALLAPVAPVTRPPAPITPNVGPEDDGAG